MKIGFIGDIVGQPGRSIIKERLQEIKESYKLDVVIANGENASHGFGLGSSAICELLGSGVDVITGGNHSWDKKEIMGFLEQDTRILRPHNYPKTAPGSGVGIYDIKGVKLAVVNIMGHFGMPFVNNAFEIAQEVVQELRQKDIVHIFVDFHAEATSEKRSLFWILHGKVSAVIGTHTHVGTDDLEIASGTLGLSDAGACGCMDGVLGMDKVSSSERFLSGLPTRLEIPKHCMRILPMIVLETNFSGQCVQAYKIRAIDDRPIQEVFKAFIY